MSTSRPSIPAVPTVVGSTDDSSRGGLFSRSNLANPVSGADVNGVPIQDSTITFTVNGEPFTGNSFTLNQDNDQTIDFRITGTGGGTADGNNFVTGGSISGETLTLTREGLDDVTISGIPMAGLDMAAVQALIDTAIAGLNPSGIVRSVGGQTPDASGNVPISTSVVEGDFQSPDSSIALGTAGDGDVTLQSRPIFIGNGVRGGLPLGTPAPATTITIDPALNFAIINDNGAITIGPQGTAPPTPPGPSGGAQIPEDLPMDVFEAPRDVPVTLSFDNGLIAGTGNNVPNLMTEIELNNRPFTPTVPPIVVVDTDRGGATITFDADDVDEEGDYDITIMTPVIPTGETDPEVISTSTPTISRIVPFFQSRVQITADNIRGNTVTDTGEEWDGSFNAIAGSGTLYFAVRTSDFDFNSNGFFTTMAGGITGSGRFGPIGDEFSVNDHAGDAITFQTYRTGNIDGGVPASNFRENA